MLPSYVINPTLNTYIQSTINAINLFRVSARSTFTCNHCVIFSISTSFGLKMEIHEKPNAKKISELESKETTWNNSSCRNLFRITFLRVIPLLTLIAGVVVLVLGFVHGQWTDSDSLRMVGVILVSLSLFWFVLGNFLNFCLNGYGQHARDAEKEDNTTSAAQTEVTNEDFLVGGHWI